MPQDDSGFHEGSFHYRAFISYSHVDKAWGEWLHKAIETYLVPRRLVGTPGRDGPIPKRLFPVFRDREELPTSHDLGGQITQALEQSACLIVICSPHSAASRWVNEEILAYKRMGRDNRILALIVAGEPNASDKGQPERECFPKALRFGVGHDGQLNDEQREAIAADARKGGDGKKSALLKIIAGLLGVSYDTLAQREQQRRKARLMTAVAGTVGGLTLIAGAAGAVWYEQAPHTAYFHAYATRYGLPQGVGAISRDEASHASDFVAITTQRGQVVKLAFENGLLKPVATDLGSDMVDPDLAGVAAITYDYAGDRGFNATLVGEDGKPLGVKEYTYSDDARTGATVSLKSPSGGVKALDDKASFIGDHDMTGKARSVITQYHLAFDDRGRIKTRTYLTAMGDPASDVYGSFGTAYSYNDDGLLVAKRNLDGDGRFIPLKSGVSQIRISYDSHKMPVVLEDLDDQGHLTTGDDGTARKVMTRDAYGNSIAVAFFGPDGKPALYNDWTAAKATYHYTRNGLVDRMAYFGADDRPTLSRDNGIAGFSETYDAAGHSLSQAFFGVDGEPIVSKSQGAAGVAWTYNAAGQNVTLTYMDGKGQPAVNQDLGYARIVFQRDAAGRKVSEAFFDTHDKPALDKATGVDTWTWRYNGQGQTIEQAYFIAGKPAFNIANGIARVTFGYDARGNDNDERFFGTDGKPIISRDWGAARTTYRFDNRGDIVEVDNYGSDDQPLVSAPLGYARVTYRYDERGNEVEKAYFDAAAQPIDLLPEGYARVASTYDDHGNRIEQSFYAADGSPAIDTTRGFAVARWTYDTRGNVTEVSYFGTGGQPILSTAGYAFNKIVVDDRGNVIEESHFGTDRKPINDRTEGAARVVRAYDLQGNTIDSQLFGADGQPVIGRSSHDSRFHTVFNAAGDIVEQSYFGIDGKPMINPGFGYARITREVDPRGNIVGERYFGADGRPTTNRMFGVARTTSVYDARGNETGWAYFGVDGKPAGNRINGVARFETDYDGFDRVVALRAYDVTGKLMWAKTGDDAEAFLGSKPSGGIA